MAKAKYEPTDKYQIITDKLIKLLEQDIKPWVKPWRVTGNGAFRNLVGGNIYSGINSLICLIDTLMLNDDLPYFVGFNQAKDLGWTVKKGSKATNLKWAGKVEVEVEKEVDGEKEKGFYFTEKWLAVFHVSCLDDSNSTKKIADYTAKYEIDEQECDRLEVAETLIKKTKAKIVHGGDKAFYTPSLDVVTLPIRESFVSTEGYYSTALHELVHWTGHSSRMDRNLSNLDGSGYAYEELVAEIGSAFLCGHVGINAEIENHASYLGHWIKSLKNDNKLFLTAASQARKASEFILNC